MCMREHSYFLNLSRGHIVVLEELAKCIESGKILGAGLDVFPKEPKNNEEPFESILKKLPNVILTPHIGGSTSEAQVDIANYVPEKIISYVNTGSTYGNVTLPNLQLPELKNSHRLLHIHENVPGVLAEINKSLASFNCNIVGQYLKTNEEIGYVICDIEKTSYDILSIFKSIQGTIRTRVLY